MLEHCIGRVSDLMMPDDIIDGASSEEMIYNACARKPVAR